MRLTVLGGCGAWPDAGQACSGYLVEHDGFRLLVDAGYATVPRLLSLVAAADLDAVYISHGHPDHCADLSPLLRARVYTSAPAPLPVYAPAGALTAVLALDNPRVYAGALTLHDVADGMTVDIGPFQAHTRLLPHWVPNLGVRLSAGGRTLVYTGDTGPSPVVAELATGADLLSPRRPTSRRRRPTSRRTCRPRRWPVPTPPPRRWGDCCSRTVARHAFSGCGVGRGCRLCRPIDWPRPASWPMSDCWMKPARGVAIIGHAERPKPGPPAHHPRTPRRQVANYPAAGEPRDHGAPALGPGRPGAVRSPARTGAAKR